MSRCQNRVYHLPRDKRIVAEFDALCKEVNRTYATIASTDLNREKNSQKLDDLAAAMDKAFGQYEVVVRKLYL